MRRAVVKTIAIMWRCYLLDLKMLFKSREKPKFMANHLQLSKHPNLVVALSVPDIARHRVPVDAH